MPIVSDSTAAIMKQETSPTQERCISIYQDHWIKSGRDGNECLFNKESIHHTKHTNWLMNHKTAK